MRRFDEPATAPAAAGFRVVRQINGIDKRWPVGSTIPAADFYKFRNHNTLISSHYVVVADGLGVAKPHDLPPAQPEPPRPAVEIIDDPDIVVSARKTKAHMTKLCGSEKLAADLIAHDPVARERHMRAVKVNTERERRRKKLISLSPSEVENPL